MAERRNRLLLMLKFSLCWWWWWSTITIFGARLQNQTDRLALVSFRNAIHEDPLGFLSSWNDSTHHCEWQGVLCSKRHFGRVTSLFLRSQGLGGFISPHIGNLSFLRVMVLQNNSFHGEIPSEFGNLLRLRHLILSKNSFDGLIPSNLSCCTNLKVLNLMDNQLAGGIPSNLGSLPSLKFLGLTINDLVGPIPPSIGNLSLLQHLSIGKNSLFGEIPEELSKLERLTFFQLRYNKLTGEIPLGIFNISNITYFDVGDNQLSGSLPYNVGTTLSALHSFGVDENQLTGTIPSSFMNATGLQYLYLAINGFGGPVPKILGNLKHLTILSLSLNPLQEDANFISSLSNCSNLEYLFLANNLIHGSLPRSISNLSTSVKFINLGDNQIQGTIPAALANLFKLSVLSLANNFLAGSIPDSIGALHSLHILDLSGNMFTGRMPFSIGNLTLLNDLTLSSNNFQGCIPSTLGNCKQLISLDLSDNYLIGSVPIEMLGLSSLSINLNLSHNNLSGSLPLQIGSLINLGKLDVSHNRLSGLIPTSIGACLRLERLRLEANFFHGQIPQALSPLRGLEELDLSNNKFSGPIPSFLAELPLLDDLNLSFNELEGQVPEGGVFLNISAVSVSGNRKLCGGVPGLKLPLCKSPSFKNSSLSKAIVISVVAGIFLCLVLLLICLSRKEKQTTTITSTSLSLEHQFLRIPYELLLRVTDRFSDTNLIGKGNYGMVYKGILDDGTMVAVKVLNLIQRGALKSFVSECQTLGTIRHRNLVKILSICSSIDFHGNDFKALIYEFMSNESLEDWLHPRTIGQDGQRGEPRNLRLVQRLDIAIDIANAIEYLHKGCSPAIVHGDLKPSNVLLDNNMVAQVGDFGLAKIISEVTVEASMVQQQGNSTASTIRGSIGYVPPEYGIGHKVSTLGDVYSYGILLLEMFTGKRPTEEAFGPQFNLHNFVQMTLLDRVMDTVDVKLLNEAGDGQQEIGFRYCIISILRVGISCSMESPQDRMDMTKVIKELYSIKVSYEAKQRTTRM